MGELLAAFGLGNAAILGNVCLLPLYPGLFALLASQAGDGRDQRSLRWLGVLVLAGVLAVMTVIAGLLALANRAFDAVLPVLLPLSFGLVIVLGVLMVAGRNPLARLGTGQAPVVSSPAASAFLHGVAIGPMTLPCTGPVVLSAFLVGGAAGGGAFVDQLAYFLSFGLGFGWPLVLLPLLAGTAQQRFTRILTRHHRMIEVVSGVLLVVVAVIGLVVDLEL